ncbi:MAG: hypothetical protein ACYC96_08410 [Fimbriimonadaceae bacterium]
MQLHIVAVLVLGLTALSYGDPNQSDWIATPNGAYVAMPANSVTDGKVSQVSWSPDGEHLLVAERPVTTSRDQLLSFNGSAPSFGPLQVLGWDRRLHQTRALWSTDDATATIDNIAWVHGTSAALITVRWVVRGGPQNAQHPLWGVLALDAATGKYSWVSGMEQLVARPLIVPSPMRPIAVAAFSDNPEADDDASPSAVFTAFSQAADAPDRPQLHVKISGSTSGNSVSNEITSLLANVFATVSQTLSSDNFWTLDAGGNLIHTVKVAKPIRLRLAWNQNGSAWFLVDTDSKSKRQILERLTDLGRLEPTNEQEFVERPTVPDLHASLVPETAKAGKSTVNFTSVWLRSQVTEHGEMLLAADGSRPELSPTSGGVFYIEGGVGKVRELIPLSAGQREAARKAPVVAETQTTRTVQVMLNLYGPPPSERP